MNLIAFYAILAIIHIYEHSRPDSLNTIVRHGDATIQVRDHHMFLPTFRQHIARKSPSLTADTNRTESDPGEKGLDDRDKSSGPSCLGQLQSHAGK